MVMLRIGFWTMQNFRIHFLKIVLDLENFLLRIFFYLKKDYEPKRTEGQNYRPI